MNTMKKIFYPVFAFSSLLVSCEKSDHLHGEEDVLKPNIEIEAPVPNQRFRVGDTIHIKGRMWDNDDLHEAGIFMSNEHENMMDCPMMVHESREHSFDTCYIVRPVDASKPMKLTVKAEDHHHNLNETAIDLLIE
jgi:hypothetical protein